MALERGATLSNRPGSVFRRPPLTTGPWAGWTPIRGHALFEDLAVPFYPRTDEARRHVRGLRVERRRLNASGGVHGGCLMTLGDLSPFCIGSKAIGPAPSATVALSGEFVGSAAAGDPPFCTGHVTKAGRSLAFRRG